MACRFALLLDGGPPGRERPLSVHLTCRACGGHHVVPVMDRLPVDRPFRAAERGDRTPIAIDQTTGVEPTHHCRDCGHRWADVAPASHVPA